MHVTWVKCGPGGDRYCPLESVNLEDVEAAGVYITWHNTSSQVIYVGETQDVARRLLDHRSDPKILGHRGNGLLLVTWASIDDAELRLAVERYLHDQYFPVESTASHSRSQQVTLPGA